MTLWKAPEVLVIQLKRFNHEATRYSTRASKDKTRVKFPLKDFDISPYVGEQLAAEAAGGSPDPTLYDLVSVSNHSGSLNYGHYTAYARNFANGKWYSLNDRSASEVAPGVVASSEAFVLIYQRKKRSEETELAAAFEGLRVQQE